ncbi:MAG: gliding motility-associated C-terminal domain-containing protein [Flavobacteriales bacterium]|nr:gliding motility-associated C-terminal domain-containing protein [Flavobacteriales bacterium]
MPLTVSSSCGSLSLTLGLVSSQEVSLLCPSAISNCNGGPQPGVEQYIYTDTLTLPPCNDWLFAWTHCCRNNQIDNLVNPGGEQMYVEATLDNTLGCNSSPIFTNLPVPYTCNTQLYNYNHGAIDLDGDSIVYTLVNPLGSGGVPIAYMGGYSPTYPILTTTGQVDFNNQTGQMDFIPIGGQISVVTILVEEYRNGVLIGTTMRDIQVVDVLNCSNFTPALLAPGIFNPINATLTDTLGVEVCVGANMSYNFIVADPDVPDSITLTTNMNIAIPGASFTQSGINPVTVTVSWTPTQANVGLNIYTIAFQDNGCPVIGQSIIAFTIDVLNGTYAGDDVFLCDGDTAQLSLGGGSAFVWTPSTDLSNDTIANPQAWPATTTDYVVTSNYVGQCTNTDTVTVNVVTPFTLATTGDVILCSSGTAQLNAIPTPGGTYDYAWTPSATLDFDTIPNPQATPTITTMYTAAVTSTSGCTRYATQMVTVAPTPLTALPAADDMVLCQGGSTLIHANIDEGDCSAYVITQVPFAPLSGAGTSVSLSDDQVVAGLPLGFSFEFFCNDYTTFSISSNGYIAFGGGSSNGCCTGQSIPDNQQPNNLIAFAWNDLDPSVGGTVEYFTAGTTPNQILVMTFTNVPHRNGPLITSQVLLYEGSDVIEIHTTDMPQDGSLHTMGIENASGSGAFAVLGRNASIWSASNECMRFTPLTPPPYTLTWLDADSNVVGNLDSISVAPDSTITYSLIVTDGNCIDTRTVTIEVARAKAWADTTICEGDTATINSVYDGPGVMSAPTSCGASSSGCTTAGTDFTIGSGTATNSSTVYPAPYGNWYKNAKHQFLYRAAELTSAGLSAGVITDIGWFVTSISGTTLYQAYQVRMGCTSTNVLSSWESGLTTVFTPKNYTISTGYNNHVLDVAYDWDGVSNIVVEICYNNLSTAYTNNSSSPYTNTGFNSVIYEFDDSTPMCPSTGFPASSVNRPNTRFTACTSTISPTFSWSPTTDIGSPTLPSTLVWPDSTTEYVISIDIGSCVLTDTVRVSTAVVELSTSSLGESCANSCDGTTTVVAIGQTPFTYLWDDGNAQTNSTADFLCVGLYNVTVTDSSGCTDTDTASVMIAAGMVSSFLNVNMVSCFNACDAEATVVANGGGGAPYTFLWDDPLAQTNANATGLCPNRYRVTILDNNGCQIKDSIDITEPLELTSVASFTCLGGCNATALTMPTEGTPPYTFTWSDPLTQTNDLAIGLCADGYEAIVEDANGCISKDSVYVTELSATISGDICGDAGCNGSATIAVSGITGPVTYQWDDPAAQTTATATGLCQGTYNVSVTDSVLCNLQNVLIIPVPIVATITDSVNVSCFNACDGTSTVAFTGGAPPYNYLWDDPSAQSGVTATGLCGGKYRFTITDANGCESKDSTIILAPLQLVASLDTTKIGCKGDCDGQIDGTAVTGGWGVYTYLWDDDAQQTTAKATDLCEGIYTLTVIDSPACTVTAVDSVTVHSAMPMVVDFMADPYVTTLLSTTVSFTDLSTGAVIYEWEFDDGEMSTEQNPEHVFPDVEPGIYTVKLVTTNGRGCQDSLSKDIVVRGDFLLFLPNAFTPNRDGLNEYFFPQGIGIDENNFTFFIYDRWGDLVYETDDINKPWDGHVNYGTFRAQIDTYVWKIITYDVSGVEHEFVGKVTLIQ